MLRLLLDSRQLMDRKADSMADVDARGIANGVGERATELPELEADVRSPKSELPDRTCEKIDVCHPARAPYAHILEGRCLACVFVVYLVDEQHGRRGQLSAFRPAGC